MEFDAREVQCADSPGNFSTRHTTLTMLEGFDTIARNIRPIAGCNTIFAILGAVVSPLKWADGITCRFPRAPHQGTVPARGYHFLEPYLTSSVHGLRT